MILKKTASAVLVILLSMTVSGCDSQKKTGEIKSQTKSVSIVNPSGNDILTRYRVPEGYKRIEYPKGSFGYFLRHEKLKKYGEKSLYYNGTEKDSNGVYDSVYDVDLENKNLLHCADACFKFRGDYLYSTGQYNKIKFNFVGSGVADYSKYMKGYRVNPDTGTYRLSARPDNSEKTYKRFMDLVYGYCSTISLVRDTVKVNPDDMQIGDVFVRDGVPGTKRVGHAIMVVDMAQDSSGNKLFMLAQSYMPAQQPQILINRMNKKISPWYSLDQVKKRGKLITPQWTFELDELRRFR